MSSKAIMLFLIGLTNSIGGFDKLVPDAKFSAEVLFTFVEKVRAYSNSAAS